ncbi:HNH endonuclease signature motif containing protein [Leptolyngbya sp. FACHB-17]|uniref:HNH endonuclease n=1 Tax=unclassified Leptolyngbya TaxID=2650499 RepID=UPI0032206D2D
MTTIPASLRRFVIQRADNRCEYCRISQVGQAATFHIDHIVPVVAGGETIADNLALACVSCSLRKGARQIPKTRRRVKLFQFLLILDNRYEKSILVGMVWNWLV